MSKIKKKLNLRVRFKQRKFPKNQGGFMQKNALIVVTSNDQLGNSGKTGWHLSEVSHVFYPLRNAGFNIDFASPKGGLAPLDESSLILEDEDNKEFVSEKKIKDGIETLRLQDIEPDNYQVIYFSGGHGTMWDFPDNEDINRITARIYENGGIVAAVCHGPAALTEVKLADDNYLIAGKEVNSFTNEEEKEVGKEDIVPFLLETKLRERGAKFQAAEKWGNKVVISERLITGQNPQSAASLGNAIVALFGQREREEAERDQKRPGLSESDSRI